MKLRIKEYPKGWVVEIQKRKWYGKKYWTHLVSVAGIVDEPWYHSDFDSAMESLIFKIEQEVIINSR